MNSERREDSNPIVTAEELLNLVNAAKGGDGQAFNRLDGYIRSRIVSYFIQHLAGDAEDLTQRTLISIFKDLPKFDPNLGRGTFSQNFHSWARTIARNILYDELGRRARRGKEHQLNVDIADLSGSYFLKEDDQEASNRADLTSLFAHLKERIHEVIPKRQRRIIDLVFEDKKNDEIASELGLSKTTIEHEVAQARGIIEKQIVFPAGYKPIVAYDNDLEKAASKGNLQAVKFLRRWYTTEEAMGRYQLRRRTVEQSLLEQGYLLLHAHVSNTEYRALVKVWKNVELIKRWHGRIYITPENLAEFRRRRQNNKLSREISDGVPQKHVKLGSFAATVLEYERLQKAVRKGILPAVKIGKLWFTTQEAVAKFCENG